MTKHLTKRAAAIEKQARLEIMLAKVKAECSAATFHKNALVADCLNKADAAMLSAAHYLFANRLDKFAHMSDVVWLLICFAKKILDADTIEHLLGESDYLELNEDLVSPTVRATRAFADLEKLIFKLRADIRDKELGAPK
jgi:hypothetical protein